MIQAKSDLFFRYLLGREEDEDLRVDFINSVLAFLNGRIKIWN